MDSGEFLDGVNRTWRPTVVNLTPWQEEVLHAAIGLVGEAGEIMEHIKKNIFQGRKEFMQPEDLKKEFGDVEYYLTKLEDLFGLAKDDVLEANNAKLKARWPNGWVDGTGGNRTGEGA
jgi:NTP pyrophosphatase (non-canonical NTP hydrolase)